MFQKVCCDPETKGRTPGKYWRFVKRFMGRLTFGKLVEFIPSLSSCLSAVTLESSDGDHIAAMGPLSDRGTHKTGLNKIKKV